jgi:hypothetical protein
VDVDSRDKSCFIQLLESFFVKCHDVERGVYAHKEAVTICIDVADANIVPRGSVMMPVDELFQQSILWFLCRGGDS